MYGEQLLPHSIEAEEAVLGAVLINTGMMNGLAGRLAPGDFYRDKHRLIWQTMKECFKDQQPADQVVVSRRLGVKGELEAAGGLAFLSHLVSITPNSVNGGYYAGLVKEASRLRSLISVAGQLQADAYGDSPSGDLIQQGVSGLLRIDHQDGLKRPWSATELYDEYQATFIEELEADENYIRGGTTGFRELDRILGGYIPGLCYLVGARTSVGKTSFSARTMLSVSRAGGDVFGFTMETTKKELMYRIVYSAARVDSRLYRHLPEGAERDKQRERVLDALNEFDHLPLTLYDQRGLTPSSIRAVLQSHVQAAGKPALVVIDYLNLVASDGRIRGEYEDLSEAAKRIKDLGGELDVPIMLLAQYNRASESRPDVARKPALTDFRGSGHIEQLASVVLGLYRDSYYYQTSEEKQKWEHQHGRNFPENVMEVHVLKQQNGPTGMVPLYCELSTGFMSDLGREREA